MLSKLRRPYDPANLPPEKRLRPNLADVYGSNQLTANRVQEIINDSYAAGAKCMKSLQRPVGKNAARNLQCALLKRSQWPSLYWAKVAVRNRTNHTEEEHLLAFMLPHELAEVLWRLGDHDVLYSESGMDPLSQEHVRKCKEASGSTHFVGMGLWGDGVPVNWDRTESVETFSLNFPGLSGDYRNLRMPLTAISRKQVSGNTWRDIMTVLAWSFQHCAAGVFPLHRHDGTPWLPTDRKRMPLAGLPLGFRAALCEIRGDWKFYGETFHFPKWNTKAGICWLCECTPDQV